MKPAYWERAKRALAKSDPVLGEIIRRHPGVYLRPRGDAFLTLARAIVGQQISVKAAQSVWDRFAGLLPLPSPAAVAQLPANELRGCGLSARKCEYIRDLALRFAAGEVQAQRWPRMDDEAVIAELVELRGIGRWTAEMFLIFNLLRPDVYPLADLGLQKGIQLAYFKRKPTLGTMRRLGEAWRPWRSVATWYLWRSLDPLPVEY